MTSLSDTLTVGLVLILLFGSIALYLYTRIQQAEQKLSLLESILLDLKMSSEIKSYTELPADNSRPVTSTDTMEEATYVPYSEDNHHLEDVAPEKKTEADNDLEQYKSVIENAVNDNAVATDGGMAVESGTTVDNGTAVEAAATPSKMDVNYEAMTIKELQNIARARGITGAGSMKKGSIIEALKTSDRSQMLSAEPGLLGKEPQPFHETSSNFPEQESQ